MSVLADLFDPDSISLNVSATSKAEAFRLAADYFAKKLSISNELVVRFLNDREALGSTALGAGVAIPHGRIKGLKQSCAAFFRLPQGIEFQAPDQLPVSILIFLLVPEKATQDHLEILSTIAQLLSDTTARETLQQELDPNKVSQFIRGWSP
ncbi:MAG: PTS sugar transporter subunit IIA [Polynucleobacter sp.]|jgi:PTS system nitrogen regulatory IIA component|nr:PTS sugar transporter subunit IIA [Polynucleobacter sp.]